MLKKTPNNVVIQFAQGCCMGVAEAIPGVNGATVALLLNIYTRIIDAIKSLTLGNLISFAKHLVLFWRQRDRRELHRYAEKMQLAFLVPIALGSLLSIFLLSGIIPLIVADYPAQANAFIFGIVAVSSYIPISHIKHRRFRHVWILVLSAVLTFALVGLPSSNALHALPLLYVYGAIGACALLLPGLSGSYLLKVFGEYEYILQNLHDAFLLDISAIVVIGVFVLGMITGLILFARLLSWLLHHHHGDMMAILAGLTIGALRALWPFVNTAETPHPALLIGFVGVGAIVMVLLIAVEEWRQRQNNE